MNIETITPTSIVKNLMYIPTFLLGMSMHSFTILIVFIACDMITGIWRVAAISGGKEIKSAKAINGLASKMLFAFVPLVIAYTGKGIGLDLAAFASGTLSLLIVSTAYSIIGNIYTIRTGVVIAEFDAMRVILNAVKGLLDKITIDNKHK